MSTSKTHIHTSSPFVSATNDVKVPARRWFHDLQRTAVLVAALMFAASLGAVDAFAATYYVDNTNSNANDSNAGTNPSLPWRTVQRCANTLVAGDVCNVAAGGIYNERVTESTDGTSANRIVYRATGLPRPRVRGFTLSGADYITVEGFEVTHRGMASDSGAGMIVSGATTGVLILNNYIHHVTSHGIQLGSARFLTIRGNEIGYCGPAGSLDYEVGITGSYNQFWSDVLIEDNWIYYVGDYLLPLGNRVVYRNNTIGPADPNTQRHVDGLQNNQLLQFTLVEGNRSVDNASGHNHFLLNSVQAHNVIMRFNSTLRSKGMMRWGGPNVQNLRFAFYNNTFYDNYAYYQSNSQVENWSTDAVARNNIWYRSVSLTGNPYNFSSLTVQDRDHDLWYLQGDLRETHDVSANPNFQDAASGNFRLTAGSPAIDAGGSLTTVASADSGSGTTLVVGNAAPFQDGWAGVSPDSIAVGNTSTTVRIQSINYSTNTITLAASISRSPGDPVWLYSNSTGARVLYGAAPDIGAFEFVSSAGDTTPPAVSLTAPSNGATVSGTSVALAATASDNVGVVGVQFKVNGANLGAEDTTSPYSITWNSTTVAGGSHILTAVARDSAGNQTISAPLTVTVSNTVADTTAPSVSLTAPSNGATLSGTTNLLSASASDNVAVAGVQFRLNGNNLGGEDTVPPYSINWSTTTTTNGTHTLTAVARDAAGNQTTSAAVTVTVSNTVLDTTPPIVSLTDPVSGAALSGTTNLLAAVASDNVAVAGVQFRVNGNNLGAEDTTAPYSINWSTTTTTNGTHTLTAVARDAAGNQTTSAAVTVTVSNTVLDTTPPAVSLTDPLSGATLSGTTNLLAAAASDNVAVAGVQFRVNGNNLGAEDTTAPYSINWSTTTTTNGTYTLTAVARDAAGNQTTSAAVTVTVSNTVADTTAPTISLTNPSTGATLSGTTNLLAAAASDNVAVAGVQFRVNGSSVGAEDTAAPYSINWSTIGVPNGTYTITAVARDAAGNQTTSAAVTVTVSNTSSMIRYSLSEGGGAAWNITEDADPVQVQFARVQPDSGTSSPSGLAVFGFRHNGVLVSETGVPASAPVSSGRIYAETDGPTLTGIALANAGSQDAVVSFYFIDETGTNLRTGSLTIPANQQVSAFLHQAPFNGPSPMKGTFTFTASLPVSAIALRGFTNQRGEFLMTTIPVTPLDQQLSGEVLMFPHFVDGGGWSTKVVLINPGDVPLSGTVQFLGQEKGNGTSPVRIRVGSVTASTFAYVIPPRGQFQIATERASDGIKVGSVRVAPAASSATPSGLALFTYQNSRGITVSEASIPASPSGSAFRLYVESTGSAGAAGSIRTGVAISNPLPSSVTVQLELRNLDGSATGISKSVSLPGNGQLASFVYELLTEMPAEFKGTLRVTANGPIVVAGLRGRYNERLDFLMTTTPPWNESDAPNAFGTVFPHVVRGGGYTTELIIFSGASGSGASGDIQFLNPNQQ